MSEHVDDAVVARERIAIVAGTALLAAGLILVTAVLPAEYAGSVRRRPPAGIDRDRRRSKEPRVVRGRARERCHRRRDRGAAGARHQNETVEFKLAARDSFEYRYRLDKGEALLVFMESERTRELRVSCRSPTARLEATPRRTRRMMLWKLPQARLRRPSRGSRLVLGKHERQGHHDRRRRRAFRHGARTPQDVAPRTKTFPVIRRPRRSGSGEAPARMASARRRRRSARW